MEMENQEEKIDMNITVQANPGFKEVDQSRKRYIVMKGSAGSGKLSLIHI